MTVLRRQGAKTFVATGVLYRFDMSMTPLGIILMVNGYGGSLVDATVLTGAFFLAGAICAPQISGTADRRGQHGVLLVLGAVYLCAALGLIATVMSGAPLWASVCFGLLAGATNPMVSAMVRARWSALYHGNPLLRTAFAMESMIDAVVIAMGAPLATFLAAFLFPAATLLIAALTATASAWLLAVQRGTEPAVSAPEAGRTRGSGFIPPNIWAVLLLLLFVGVHLGSFDVATVAVALDAGQQQWAGWTLAAYAIGSTVGGGVIGSLKETYTAERLLNVSLAVLSVTVVPLLFVQVPALRLAFGLTAGLAVAPTIILAMTLVEKLSAPGLLTTSLGWASSALITGNAAGQVLAGHAADWQNGHAGYAVTLAGGVLGLGTALSQPRPRAGRGRRTEAVPCNPEDAT
ncbi:hypothetical protein [Streptomyces sp. NPDC003247]|uniref:hypothetical protein n=1 Tax=Streptomyces sp. NPDC003247 TaxID=3364677 RepID=UPI0036C83FBF